MRRQVDNGEFPPGGKLPNLHALAEQYGVARVTVRQAVQLLVSQKYLISSQGRGTYVASQLPERTYTNLRTSWDALARRIEGASVELLEECDCELCPFLDAQQALLAAPVYHYMKRVHIKDGVRFAFIDIYLDKRIFMKAPGRFNETTVIPVLGELGIQISKARQLLTIDTVTREVAGHLHLEAGSPVALLTRIAQDMSGCYFYAAKVVHPGNSVRLDIDLTH